MTDEPALLRAICERPAEDMPRLAYADWLDANAGTVDCSACRGTGWRTTRTRTAEMDDGEYCTSTSRCDKCHGTCRVSNGYAERAEFIRVQVELDKVESWNEHTGANGFCSYSLCDKWNDLRCRERELWRSGDSPLREWFEVVGQDVNLFVGSDTFGVHTSSRPAYIVRRGFVSSIILPWEMVTEDVLRDLFTRHPIESVVVTGAPIRPGNGADVYLIGESPFPVNYWAQVWYGDTREDLQSALNAVALAWGRELAGLTPLVPVMV